MNLLLRCNEVSHAIFSPRVGDFWCVFSNNTFTCTHTVFLLFILIPQAVTTCVDKKHLLVCIRYGTDSIGPVMHLCAVHVLDGRPKSSGRGLESLNRAPGSNIFWHGATCSASWRPTSCSLRPSRPRNLERFKLLQTITLGSLFFLTSHTGFICTSSFVIVVLNGGVIRHILLNVVSLCQFSSNFIVSLSLP